MGFLKKIKLRTIHQKILVAFLMALLVTGLIDFRAIYTLDTTVEDLVYQSENEFESGDVALIGIDAASQEEYGLFPWTRDVLTRVIEVLNQDEENRPAAIGIDVIWADPGNPVDDARLVEVAGKYNNVVLACMGTFGDYFDIREEPNGEITEIIYQEEENYVYDLVTPFPALRAVTHLGAINSKFDFDGRLRHAIWQIEVIPEQGGQVVPSFARELVRLYSEHNDIEQGTPPIIGRNLYFVKFTKEPGMYFTCGVADLLNGEVSPDEFVDKIVLIGPYDPALKDAFITAKDHGVEMNGVEYQANIVEMLIAQNFKAEASHWGQQLLVFVLVFVCAFLFWERKMLPVTIAWLLISSVWVLFCVLMFEHGRVYHIVWIPFGVSIAYLVSVVTNYIRAALAKMHVTNTFKKYVAPEIVSEILKEGSDALGLGGKTTDIAVLFVDIRGFTPMSEVLAAEEIVEILNRYLALTSQCIFENNGTLDKFIGDATMAFWGAPLPQDDYIYKAVKTGMDMIAMSEELGQELQEKYGRTVSFGIGIHCGTAVVGNIGAVSRMDYTAIGDTVNTAARLESNAPAGQLLISRAVADALEGRIECTSLGDSIKLKGKADGFEILRVEKLL